MAPTLSSSSEQEEPLWVPETRFGKWFLRTQIWYRYVLEETISGLRDLAGDRCPDKPVMLDIGCGQGQSFTLLEEYFKPGRLRARDVDRDALEIARRAGSACDCDVEVDYGSARALAFEDDSFDLVFCHQLIHHVTFREEALAEMFRILKPGGLLLLSESCRPFLQVYWVRLLFRHPKMEQKTAAGYKELVREAGFCFTEHDVLETAPWWSRRDFGLLEKLGLQFWRSQTAEISLAAAKPPHDG